MSRAPRATPPGPYRSGPAGSPAGGARSAAFADAAANLIWLPLPAAASEIARSPLERRPGRMDALDAIATE